MKPFVVIVFSIIVLLFLAAWQPVTFQFSPPRLGSPYTGYIVSNISGLCIEPVPGGGTANGTLVQIGPCTGDNSQYWELTSDGQLYNADYNKCLDTSGSPGTSNQVKLQLYECGSSSSRPNQFWSLTSSGYFQNKNSKRCIDVPGSPGKKSGLILTIYDCEFSNSSTTDQRWSFQMNPATTFGGNQSGFSGGENGGSVSGEEPQPDPGSILNVTDSGKLVNLISRKCFDPVGSNPTEGTLVQLSKCSSSGDMDWELTEEGYIRHKQSGYCLDVTGTLGKSNGTALRLWTCEVGMRNDQTWFLNDHHYLLNYFSNRCADVPGAYNDNDGAVLQLWDCEYNMGGNTDQQWLFESTVDDRIFTDGMTGSVLSQTDCFDADRDCISDELEQEIADEFMPYFEYDGEEHNILAKLKPEDFEQGSGVTFLYQVSVVDCSLDPSVNLYEKDVVEGEAIYKTDLNPFGSNRQYEDPRSILFTVLEIFPYDYLPKQNFLYDFTNENDVFVHYGDVETLKYCLRDDDRDGNYQIEFVNFRRHKHSYVISQTAIHQGNNWKFYASEGKHGTYISEVDCLHAIDNYQSLYWGEDCAGGAVIYPYTDDSFNVGEFSAGREVRFSDLGIEEEYQVTANVKGFPYYDEYIWNTGLEEIGDRSTYFCGGMNVPNYWDDQDVTFFYRDITCPGGLGERWWQTNNLECLEEDTDRVGSDYKMIDDLFIGQPEFCAEACMEDPACAAFTFVPGSNQTPALCYLKNSSPSPSYRKDLYSGLRANCLDEYKR